MSTRAGRMRAVAAAVLVALLLALTPAGAQEAIPPGKHPSPSRYAVTAGFVLAFAVTLVLMVQAARAPAQDLRVQQAQAALDRALGLGGDHTRAPSGLQGIRAPAPPR